MKRIVLLYLVPFILIFACATPGITPDIPFDQASEEQVNDILEKIKIINSNAPSSINAAFRLDGFIDKKKFKASGYLLYNKSPEKARITFVDSVFKSPLTTLVQDGNTIKIHFPVENTLIIDNENTINLKDYISVPANYLFLKKMITSHIPLVSEYSINRGLLPLKDDGENTGEMYLILENDKYYETVSFKNSIPTRILLVTRKSRKKFEFYFIEPSIRDGLFRYKGIEMVEPETGNKVKITFSKYKTGQKISTSRITRLDLKKNVKIFRK
jgi:hypothetical protein